MAKIPVQFTLNGAEKAEFIDSGTTLLNALRDKIGDTSPKGGCHQGTCGACSVIIDGELRLSCLTLAETCNGAAITTTSGLSQGGVLHPLQRAFLDAFATQCGFCTPGFVMSLYALWMRSPEPSDAAIEKALQGNLCRCTGYEAIMRAARAISSYGKAAKDPLAAERKAITSKLEAMKDGSRIEIGAGKQRLVVPADADDLAAVLDKEPGATIVAGSTDVGLWVTKHMREIAPAIFIGNLDGLCRISEDKGIISIGAGVTYTEAFSMLAKRIPALGPLFDRIGGDQVRNMGTIGGNIANGSPIGDTPPPLIALGARLTLRRGNKRRTISLEDFFIAYGKQDRQPGEFVEAVHVPVPVRDTKFAVYKITKRRDEDITAALGAFLLALAKDGTVAEVRIAYGGMAATPKRAFGVEKALLGRPWTEATVQTAMAEYAKDFTPLTDMRASAEYRALAARNLLLRFFAETSGTKAPIQISRHEAA
ncbi:MAG: xanthine dehydrogenase small subunit [Mesorhizobium sp.]|nr:MAG: xanthine dehydrogenase small subunit [Mesorhizobium sp.]